MFSGLLKRYIKILLVSINVLKLRGIISPIVGRYFFLFLGSPSGIQPVNKLPIDTVYEHQSVKNSVPKTISTVIHTKFYPVRKYPKAFLVYLENSYSTKYGYNLTSAGKLILETSYEAYLGYYYPDWNDNSNPDHYKIWRNLELVPNLKYYDHAVATLTTLYQSNYFHWMFDVLPRIHLLQFSKLRPTHYYVENMYKFQIETLKLLGINDDIIINANEIEYIRAKDLIVPSNPGIPGTVPGWACDYLRTNALSLVAHNVDSIETKYIYVSRKNASYRKILNEEEILAVLKKYDFRIVCLENMEFSEQVNLFFKAECVVSAHGAGLSNIVFCKQGAKIVELFSTNYVNPCYWYIAEEVGLDYHYMIGKNIDQGIHQKNRWDVKSDIVIDIKSFDTLLRNILRVKNSVY